MPEKRERSATEDSQSLREQAGRQLQRTRLKLILTYDGRDFAGWQSQTHGNTIQDQLERSFAKICGDKVAVAGAGRTDAGVHALGQCAHADVPRKKMSAGEWLAAVNGTLPRTIRVLRAQFVSNQFHARFSARGKVYRYRIANVPIMSPFDIGRAWHIAHPLNVHLLEEGAALYIGRHDFAGFAASRGKPETDTVRTIESVRINSRAGVIAMEFSGDGFLYKMVRMMVGALVRCALDKDPLEALVWRLDAGLHARLDSARVPRALPELRATRPMETASPHTSLRLAAPAEGLYLVRVHY